MLSANVLQNGRLVGLFWLLVSLGSCSIVQYNIAHVPFGLQEAVQQKDLCDQFNRPVRLGHQKPSVPKVDIRAVDPDELNDILLTFTEELVAYIAQEEAYLQQDILRHHERCKAPRHP